MRRRRATPRRSCRNGRRRAGWPLPAYRRSRPTGPDHAPRFTVAARSRASTRRAPPPHRSAPPRPSAAAALLGMLAGRLMADRRTTRCGYRRPDRRAKCRQIDAAQPAGRPEAGDRHAQGADDAQPRSSASPSRATPSSSLSIRPAFSRRAAGSTGRWSPPPGPARRTPTSPCCWSTRRARLDDRYQPHRRSAQGAAGGRAILALNKVDLVRRDTLLGLADALYKTRQLRASLHDLRPDRQRGRGSEPPPRRDGARGAVPLSRGSAFRCAGTLARGRGHARAGVPPAARRAALRRDGRDRELGRSARTAASRSSR